MPLNRLPTTWLEYTNVDVLFIARDQLELAAANHPEALAAIRRWTAAGGNLIVSGGGATWQNLPKIEQLLDLPAADEAAGDPAHPGWTAPDKTRYGRPLVRKG